MGSTRKKPDTAALEDRDKPYACDSESSTEGLVRGAGGGHVTQGFSRAPIALASVL